MATKAKTPAPIDRPLAKGYLREFGGWSPTFPPGVSEPNTLRKLENVTITREGAAAIRPGLRSVLPKDVYFDTSYGVSMVGSFEHFYTNEGKRAILFAYRRADKRVCFSSGIYNEEKQCFDIVPLDDARQGFAIPQGMDVLSFGPETTYVRYVQIDNKILALSNAGEPCRLFYVGENKRAAKVNEVTYPRWEPADQLTVLHPDASWINSAFNPLPTAETPTADTLISSDASKNTYNYAYFYTFYNEFGESAGSPVTIVKAARGYSTWRMLQPDSSGNPTTTSVGRATVAMDQLVAVMPEATFNAAKAQGAIGWNLYGFTWTDQGNVPVEGMLIDTRRLDDEVQDRKRWIAHTPLVNAQDASLPIPNEITRDNFTKPPTASQGLVVGDRIVLVYDRSNAARIMWSSNQQGEYINFSSSKGGGFKTLTAGNLQVPASVKLWQNPQSVDTITILCTGLDGYSTAYYMSPNTSVNGQTASTLIMGFEETTATPGTVAPYGVEVLNNALYHPLDPELMKSTASNYNITHKSMTELIQNKWSALLHKENIVSSQLDNKLYYIVHNPDGAPLEEGCMGNEVWICDTAFNNVWYRWLVQGQGLRKLDIGGRLLMAIARPNGIYVFDEQRAYDEFPGANKLTEQRAIDWELETNTQGANRAHDAWALLQQLNITFGNFQGTLQYGIKGYDTNGFAVDASKIFRQLNYVDISARPLPFDIEDFLLVRKYLKEWYFYASSVTKDGNTLPSYGQISLVQYRFTQASVNVGYEFGSVETFEYGRSQDNWNDRQSDNGIPQPYIDTRMP